MITLPQACSEYIENKSRLYSNKNIIDLGCGTGQSTVFFGYKNKVVGIDLQNVVQKKNKNFSFRKANVTKIPYKDSFFHLAISFDVLEHIEDDKKMLREAYRVLKKGGKIFFGTPNRLRITNVILRLIGHPRIYPYCIGEDRVLGKMIHVREYVAKELKILLHSVGFQKIKITPFWFGTPFLKYGTTRLFKWNKKFCQYLFFEATKL